MASAGLSSLIAAHNLSISSHSCKNFSNVSFPVNSQHAHRLFENSGNSDCICARTQEFARPKSLERNITRGNSRMSGPQATSYKEIDFFENSHYTCVRTREFASSNSLERHVLLEKILWRVICLSEILEKQCFGQRSTRKARFDNAYTVLARERERQREQCDLIVWCGVLYCVAVCV